MISLRDSAREDLARNIHGTTDGAGRVDIDATLSVAAGTGVAATATDAENNTSEFSQCFAVGGSSMADLAISAGTDVGAVAAGRSFNYYVTVHNYGPGTAAGVTMTDPLPSQTTFVDVAPVAGWSITTPAAGSGGSVVATTGAIPPARSRRSSSPFACATMPRAETSSTRRRLRARWTLPPPTTRRPPSRRSTAPTRPRTSR
ncbi:MAG: DUF11 domain-containing protein [Blastocatellia bacterium]|nr:DUF11 domain-containing protein [Blastocatellia bacterium]